MSLITTPTDPNANSYLTLAEAEAYLSNLTDVDKWTALTDDQKEALLIKATLQIDSLRFFHDPYFTDAVYNRDKQRLKHPTLNDRRQTGIVATAGANFITDTGRQNQETEPDDTWNNGAIVITYGTGQGQTRKISDFEASTGKITVSENWTTTPDATSQYIVFGKIRDVIKYAVVEQALFNLFRDRKTEAKMMSGVKSYRIGDLSEDFGAGGVNARIPVCSDAKTYLKGLYTIMGRLEI